MSELTTRFIAVTQHYSTRRWCLDGFLTDAEHGKRYLAACATKTRSTHPVTEILEIDPPVGRWDSISDFPIISPERGGEFYSITGHTFKVLGRYACKPWK